MAFVFLSYNHADTEDARAIAAHLKLAGADVWIDEWEVRAGDSIPGKLNEGLSAFDTFVLVWSESAARSNWVREELQSAIQRGIDDEVIRIVPVLIDRTPLPSLLAPLRHLRINEGAAKVVDEILGFTTERSRTMAIQQTLGEAGIDVRDIPGYGPIVGCPKCGAGLKSISGWMQTDYERDDVYAGARCAECGWSDGGEI